MANAVTRFILSFVLAASLVGCGRAFAAAVSFSDDRATTIDATREFRIFPVSAEPNHVVVGFEASVSFSRFPDPIDNAINPFYEDIRIAIISPEQTFVPMIDFDSFDTLTPDSGFSGTLFFRDDAADLIGDTDGDDLPDGSIVEGTFRPASAFENVFGERAAGGWLLMLEDRLSGTNLTYLGAELTLHTAEANSCDEVDGGCNVDINELTLATKSDAPDPKFDLDGSGTVDVLDRRYWIVSLANTYFGDSNLDGEFNSSDFVSVFQAAEYDDAIIGNSTWETGDWNGDCEFDSGDFVVAFQEAGYNAGPRRGVAIVPEPASLACLGVAFLVAVAGTRQTQRR